MLSARFLRSALTIVVIAMTALAAGCGSAAPVPHGPGHHGVLVEHDRSNGTTVHVRVGDRVALILSSSYWNIKGSSAPAILRQEGPAKPFGPRGHCVMGGGCQPQRAFFAALAPGTAVITAGRTTCGEALACGGAQRHFSLTVIVG
jgi:hypothetical protein